MIGRYFQDGQIGVRVLPDHLGKEFRLVREADFHFRSVSDHVVIRNNVAVGINDDPRA